MAKLLNMCEYKKCSKCAFIGRIHVCSPCKDKSNYEKQVDVLESKRRIRK